MQLDIYIYLFKFDKFASGIEAAATFIACQGVQITTKSFDFHTSS